MPTKPRVSIVVPLYNEEQVIDELFGRLVLLEDARVEFDLLFVNDGSSDATSPKIRQLITAAGRGRLVELSRNWGQQAAFRAGLEYADGDAVVLMDGDLQDPPEFIPQMVEAWLNGANAVTACRRSRQERGLRRLLFDAFHWTFFRLTDGAMPQGSGTFGLFDRKIAEHIKTLNEVTLFLPALRHWPGYRREVVYYDRQERAAGETKQSLSRLFRYAWDGIVSFSELPLRWITVVGVLVSLCGFAYAALLIVQRVLQAFGYFTDFEVLGFTTIVVAVLTMGGLQLIALGVVGEYVARIYREAKHRPVFLVDEVFSPGPSAEPHEAGSTALAADPSE